MEGRREGGKEGGKQEGGRAGGERVEGNGRWAPLPQHPSPLRHARGVSAGVAHVCGHCLRAQ